MSSPSDEEIARKAVDALIAREGTDQNQDLEDAFNSILSMARWIPRGIDPFIDLPSVFEVGMGQSDPSAEFYDQNLAIYTKIVGLHTGLPALLAAFQEKGEDGSSAFSTFIAKMTHVMRDSRSQDTNGLKMTIISYLPEDTDKDVVEPPITGFDKHKRGWNHKWTARALCPLKDIERFDRDPTKYMKEVLDGNVKLKAKNFPSFLYLSGTVYDPNQPDLGLFRGHVLIRALRHIYTGQSSAFSGHRAAARASQAEIHNMRTVTPSAIAYAACQSYVSLSSLPQWSSEDGYFNLEKFRRIIIRLFRDESEPWVKETLTYLTGELPSLARKARKKRGRPDDDDDDDDDDDPTGILGLRIRRAEEAKRAAEEEARHAAEGAVNRAGQLRDDYQQPLVDNEGAELRPLTPPPSSPAPGEREDIATPNSPLPEPSPPREARTLTRFNRTITSASPEPTPYRFIRGSGIENDPPEPQSLERGEAESSKTLRGGFPAKKRKVRKRVF